MCGMQAVGNMSYAAEVIERWAESARDGKIKEEICSERDLIASTSERSLGKENTREWRSLRTVMLSSPFRGEWFDSMESNKVEWRERRHYVQLWLVRQAQWRGLAGDASRASLTNNKSLAAIRCFKWNDGDLSNADECSSCRRACFVQSIIYVWDCPLQLHHRLHPHDGCAINKFMSLRQAAF